MRPPKGLLPLGFFSAADFSLEDPAILFLPGLACGRR
jgi:hypothetical protein